MLNVGKIEFCIIELHRVKSMHLVALAVAEKLFD